MPLSVRWSLGVALTILPSLPAQGQAGRVSGFVRDAAGTGVVAVEVAATGTGLVARSDTLGRFSLGPIAPGRQRLDVRRLGYRPTSVEVIVPMEGTVGADIRVEPLAQLVEAVAVTARMTATDRRLQGFYARSQRREGGYFIARPEIERRNATDVLQLLRGVPSLRVLPNSRLGRGVQLRGKQCQPLVFIDGFPASAGPYDFEGIDPASVEGIEVYSGIGSVPPEFLGPRGLDQCGVIAIWGRQAPQGASKPLPARRAPAGDQAAALVREMLAEARAFAFGDVDPPVLMDQKTFRPAYPAILQGERKVARVHLEFVVDTAGVVLWETLSVVSTTDARFNSSVREALQFAQFTPAIRKGRRVAQVVQIAATIVPPTPTPDER